jgi:endoglucanase
VRPQIGSAVGNYVGAAAAASKIPVLVAYNIPARDCGQASAGGAGSLAAYQDWIRAFATALGNRQAIVVLEPDALPQLDCLDANGKAQRVQLFQYAVTQFKNLATRTSLYLDIGNSSWLAPAEAATRLANAGIANAHGFSLNVSNYRTDAESNAYGVAVSNALQQQKGYSKPFVVDTSRNGAGPNGTQWCDPAGRKIGVP